MELAELEKLRQRMLEDTLGTIQERRENFLKDPREGIKRLIQYHDESVKDVLNSDFLKRKPIRGLIFIEVHKDYAELVGKVMQNKAQEGFRLREHDTYALTAIQTNQNQLQAVVDYEKKEKAVEVIGNQLGKAYATSLEMLWKKVKKIVLIAGLNPDRQHLNIQQLKEKLEKLERTYSISVPNIKNILNSKLRNSVQHIQTYVEKPETVVFQDVKDPFNPITITKLSFEQIYEGLVNATVALMAMSQVELTAYVSMVEPLLKLDDTQLKEYTETGILTEDMLKKITADDAARQQR